MPTQRTRLSKHWIMTINNPVYKTEEEMRQHLHEDLNKLEYFVWQLESGVNETLHIQGYIIFKARVRISALQLLFPGGHFEIKKGTPDQARDYCRKQDTRVDGPWEIGVFVSSSTDNKHVDFVKACQDGISDKELQDRFPTLYLRYFKAVDRIKLSNAPVRTWKTKVVFLYGPTGTGKSRWAQQFDPDAYWKQRSDWWDLYENQSTVVLDDFYGWLKWDTLLRLGDQYKMLVEVKGGTVQFVAKTLIITSNSLPRAWYKESPNINIQALYRRIEEWHFMPTQELNEVYTNLDDFFNSVFAYPRM